MRIKNLCKLLLVLPFIGMAQKHPNIIFIAVDDMNDWVEPLGGNPQALTPNIDAFAKDGTVIFKNAVTAAPICGPSRSALLSGFLPSTSGVYGNAQNMLYSDIIKENATLPEYFSKNGYYTLSNGKMFHKHGTKNGLTDFGAWAFDEFARGRRYNKDKADPKRVTSSKGGIINGKSNPEFKDKRSKLSWGPTVDSFKETVDYAVADWAKNQLERDFKKPFFMSVGFIKPHLPWFVPQEFFDKYKLENIKVPEVFEDDLEDITNAKGKQKFNATGEYNWIKKHGLEKEATRAYLANISYADACLGMVFDALKNSKYADNTIVMVFGDHGWHLGEKKRYLKNTLWTEAVKPPLFVKMPQKKGSTYNNNTVSLLDMYPTLIDLCGLPTKENLDGNSFAPLLKNNKTKWEYPGITVSNEGTSVLTQKLHYIQYLDGTEELYDVVKDPAEHFNIIKNKKYKNDLVSLRKHVPKIRKTPSKEVYGKPKNYVDADQDSTIKPLRELSKLK